MHGFRPVVSGLISSSHDRFYSEDSTDRMVGQAVLSFLWGFFDARFSGMVTGLALVILVALIAKLARRTYRAHLHPLSSFKGLPEACVSENWLYKVTKSGRAEQTFEALHEKYSMYSLNSLRSDQLLILYLKYRHKGSSNWT